MIAPMTVSATREMRRRDDGSATIDVLDGAEIRRTHAAHPSGIMNRVPGVHVSDLSGEGHSMAIRQPITTKRCISTWKTASRRGRRLLQSQRTV